jgi:hypothetical protein
MGEISAGVTAYQGGYLFASQQWGTASIPNMVRRINAADSIVETMRLDSTFTFYFHTVAVTNFNIFVFGVPTFTTSQVVNLIIMDSTFSVLQQKQIQLPFNIVTCKFFPAMDGGAIGVVQEVCNESRIFRLDAQGNILWSKNFVGIIQPPGGYDRTIVSSINMYASGRYLVCGHLGFGEGEFVFTIDDDGALLNSNTVELFPNDAYTDGVRMSAFNGQQLFCVVDNATNGMDTTYLISFDTSLNVVQTRHLVLSDSTMQIRAIVVTPTEFICAFSMASYSPFDSVRVAICGIDKLTLALNWVTETQFDGTEDLSFGAVCGASDANNNPVFFGNYGLMNFQNNGGNNFDFLAMTKLDAVSHNGFCDGWVSTGLCTTINYINTPYYIDTIPSTNYSVVNYSHNITTLPVAQPVLMCGPSVNVDELSGMTEISAFPNPTNGIVSFNSSVNVVVTDIYGNKVAEYANVMSIDLSEYAAAIYALTFYSDESVYLSSAKVVKQ